MKVLFIETRKKSNNKNINLAQLNNLDNFHIFYSIQYKNLAEKLFEKLKKQGKKIHISQILGCSEPKTKAKNIILVSSGSFHSLPLTNITNINNKQIYIFNNGKLKKIDKKEIENQKKSNLAKIAKYYFSEKIGIIVSIKPGQYNMKEALNFKTDKKHYIFISDTINLTDLENFNIDFWLNTSCSALSLDSKRILNIKDIKK